MRFKTKAEKQKAEADDRKENEKEDSSASEMKRSNSPPLPIINPQDNTQLSV